MSYAASPTVYTPSIFPKIYKLCSNAGFMKIMMEGGDLFIYGAYKVDLHDFIEACGILDLKIDQYRLPNDLQDGRKNVETTP